MIWLDIYMDVIYLIDMFRNFTQPYSQEGRLVKNNKMIAKQYLKTWFLADVYAFYPLAYLRYISSWEAGGKNAMEMFMAQNFERLPRFYKIMLLF